MEQRDDSYEKRRIERRKRREKELRRNLTITAGVAAVLIVGLTVGIRLTKGLKKEAVNPTEAAVSSEIAENMESPAEVQPESITEVTEEAIPEASEPAEEPVVEEEAAVEEVIPEAVEEETPVGIYNPASDTIPDRSNFAVDPNIPCGSDHNNGQNIVYLTIDDGPSYLTQQVLDIFDQYGVKATFFVTAQDPEYFYMIKEAYNRGHTIGLHSYSHDYQTIYTSVEGYFADLDRIGQIVQEQIGYVPCFIRFPGGEANMISADYCPGIMSQLVYEVNARGYQYYNWNISSGDGGNIDDPAVLAANATACDYPNILLLSHDSGGKEATVAALPAIIEHYLSLGYEFRALDRDTFSCHAEVRN